MPSKGKAEAPAATQNLLDKLFPVWNDAEAAKPASGAYEDRDGQVFPEAAARWLDEWKRPASVVANIPGGKAEVVSLETIEVNGKPTVGGASGRVFKGALYFGNPQFEWLMGQFLLVQQVQAQIPKSQYLFELIHPQQGGLPVISSSGQYHVKLWLVDGWRTVTVDDRIPLDLFGRPLVVASRPLQLWPILLSKAVMKVMALYHILERKAPHDVPVFHMLTSWPLENLVSPLNGISATNGDMFDRLEMVVRESPQPPKRRRIACSQLKERKEPKRPPPRVFVFTGPAGAAKRKVIEQLVKAYPDIFGRVVTHTTRKPMEHEVDGVDYHFVDKPGLRALQDEKGFIEVAKLTTTHGREQLYGTSYQAIRSVAAGGKICVLALDVQGATALYKDDRVDAAFVYVAPQDITTLEKRLRARLKEHASTIQKRLTWAEAEIGKAKDAGGLVDDIIDNSDDKKQVYWDVKEAVAKLSPIVRNRLHGIPGYILDYSDLIISNHVEKPFLKPVLLSGPATDEKWDILQSLADEFPDVFEFPMVYTDEPGEEAPDPYDERDHHRPGTSGSKRSRCATPRNLPAAELPDTLRDAISESDAALAAPVAADVIEANSPHHSVFPPNEKLLPEPEPEGSDGPISLPDLPRPLPPSPQRMSREEFDERVAKGEFVAVHQRLFRHEKLKARIGYRVDELKAIMKAGKIPLLDAEAVSVVQQFRDSKIDCLSVFLQPGSGEIYHQRVKTWLTETDRAISQYVQQAKHQMRAVVQARFFDEVLINRKLNQAAEDAIAITRKYRPDLFKDISTGEDDPYAKEPWRMIRAIFLAGHPTLSKRDELLAQLVAFFPDKFAALPECTTRKANKEEVEGQDFFFGFKAPDLEKLKEEGKVISWREAGGDIYCRTLQGADQLYEKSGKIALVAVSDDEGLVMVQKGLPPKFFLMHVTPSEATRTARYAAIKGAQEGDQAAEAGAEQGKKPEQDVVAVSAEVTDNLRIAHVGIVIDDDITLAVADARALLAGTVKHHITHMPLPLVIAGPFGSGKKQLMQRMLTIYPQGFELPVVYTTNAAAGDSFKVVDRDFITGLKDRGHAVFVEEVENELYTVSYVDIRRISAHGKVCLVEAESIAAVRSMRAWGLDAYYIHLRPPSNDWLLQKVQEQIGADPPLGYSPEDAVTKYYEAIQAELRAASEHPELWDKDIQMHEDADASYYCMMEAVADNFTDVVPPCHVWGYGRQLWDKECRVHGHRPLCVMILGPAAVGKTTVASRLAHEFGMVHLNAGDLLFEEVRERTKLGRRAKKYLDASQLVPDSIFNQMVWQRLVKLDVKERGFLLDGYPHTQAQIEFLNSQGLVPDKVIFMTGTHEVLLDRIKGRRMDYARNYEPFHLPEHAGALSPVIKPLKPDGSVDEERLASLQVRHDDTEDNVKERLRLWDLYVAELRASYKDVSLTVNGSEDPSASAREVAEFITIEERHADSIQPVRSQELEDLVYSVVDTIKYRRMPLVKLRQADGDTFWVRFDNLAPNSLCLNVHQLPALFAHTHRIVRDAMGAPPPQPLLLVDKPEPTSLLMNLTAAVQVDRQRDPPPPHKLLLVTGAAGSGKTTLIEALRRSIPERLVMPVLHATAPLPWAPAAEVVDQFQFVRFLEKGYFMYNAELADGTRWGLVHEEVKDLVEGTKSVFVVVEEHPNGVLAAREAGLDCLVAHVTVPDTDTLDQRIRMSSKQYEEQQVSDFIAEAPAQMQALAARGVVDVTVSNGGDIATAHSVARAFLAVRWHARPRPEDCQALVQVYDWAADAPYPTARRMQHVVATASTLELPRGRHLLRITVDPNYVHAFTVWSRESFKLEDAPSILQGEAGLHVLEATDSLEAMAAGAWRVACRHTFKVPEPCSMTLSFMAAPEPVQQRTRVLLIDNDTEIDRHIVLTDSPRLNMQPNEKGYTVMALVHAAAATPAGTYRLRLASDRPLTDFAAVPSARCERLQGAYEQNRNAQLWRYALSPLQPCSVAVRVEASPGVAGTLYLEAAASGGGDAKGKKGAKDMHEPAAAEPRAPLTTIPVTSESVVPVLTIPAGRHVLTLAMDRNRCDFDILPNGRLEPVRPQQPALAQHDSSSAVSGGDADPSAAKPPSVQWQLFLAPTLDEKACPIARDTSRETEKQAQLKQWIEQGAGGAKDRPKNSEAAMSSYLQLRQAAQQNEAAAVLRKAAGGEQMELQTGRCKLDSLNDANVIEEPETLLQQRGESLSGIGEHNASEAQAILGEAEAALENRKGRVQKVQQAQTTQRGSFLSSRGALEGVRGKLLEAMKTRAAQAVAEQASAA